MEPHLNDFVKNLHSRDQKKINNHKELHGFVDKGKTAFLRISTKHTL